MSSSLIAPVPYRFTLAECRSLSRRAWVLRRFHAARLGVPVIDVSWRECLLLAKREQMKREVWKVHAALVQVFPRQVQPLSGISQPVSISVPAPVRSRWTGLARAAAIAVALILI